MVWRILGGLTLAAITFVLLNLTDPGGSSSLLAWLFPAIVGVAFIIFGGRFWRWLEEIWWWS